MSNLGGPSLNNETKKAGEDVNIDEIDQRFQDYFNNLDTQQYDILKQTESQKELKPESEADYFR